VGGGPEGHDPAGVGHQPVALPIRRPGQGNDGLAGASDVDYTPNVSRIEQGGEMELSTLRSYVEALGGRLQVSAIFGEEHLPCHGYSK
jgi:hypothetical protein